MSKEIIQPIEVFNFEDKVQQVKFSETMDVTTGVQCDVYSFVGDDTKDLGIIRIQPKSKTPLQRVLHGDRTVEGYVSGKGKLVIKRANNQIEEYEVGKNIDDKLSINVNIGDLMQWVSSDDSPLVAYEICFPPYQDGRYENI
jgi:hypothetical protein